PFLLIEVPCNAHRRLDEHRRVDTRCLDTRAPHDKHEDREQEPTHDAPPGCAVIWLAANETRPRYRRRYQRVRAQTVTQPQQQREIRCPTRDGDCSKKPVTTLRIIWIAER